MLLFIGMIFFFCFLYFAFFKLNSVDTTAAQWRNYINPLNQVFLFFGGFCIDVLSENLKLKNYVSFILLFIFCALFVLYPVKGDRINCITNENRIVFTFLCLGICFCFYKITLSLPKIIHYPLSKLGECTYSIYLLHPIIWAAVGFLFSKVLSFHLSTGTQILVASVLSVFSSIVVYHCIEKKFMNLGRSINAKKNTIS